MECICEILALGGGQLGQVKSVDIKISLSRGWPYFGLHTHTHTHMQDRLDKSRSALADARLKTLKCSTCAFKSLRGFKREMRNVLRSVHM